MRITAEWLDECVACESAVLPFLAAHPGGAVLTRGLLDEPTVRPHLDWLARNLPITPPARATYDAARVQTWATCEAAIAQTWAPHEAALALARAPYDAARAPALWAAITESGLA